MSQHNQQPKSRYYVSTGDRAGDAGTYYFDTLAEALTYRDSVLCRELCAQVNGINAEGGCGDDGQGRDDGLTEDEREEV
jgi:hypothetical protein